MQLPHRRWDASHHHRCCNPWIQCVQWAALGDLSRSLGPLCQVPPRVAYMNPMWKLSLLQVFIHAAPTHHRGTALQANAMGTWLLLRKMQALLSYAMYEGLHFCGSLSSCNPACAQPSYMSLGVANENQSHRVVFVSCLAHCIPRSLVYFNTCDLGMLSKCLLEGCAHAT